jgi:hypothetical protein
MTTPPRKEVGSYAYCLGVGETLHLLIGIRSPILHCLVIDKCIWLC